MSESGFTAEEQARYERRQALVFTLQEAEADRDGAYDQRRKAAARDAERRVKAALADLRAFDREARA